MAYDTYETKAPWILFRYLRADWWAMCVGAKVRMLCLVCGSIRMAYMAPWNIWCSPAGLPTSTLTTCIRYGQGS